MGLVLEVAMADRMMRRMDTRVREKPLRLLPTGYRFARFLFSISLSPTCIAFAGGFLFCLSNVVD